MSEGSGISKTGQVKGEKKKKKGKKRNLRDAFCPLMTKLPLQTTEFSIEVNVLFFNGKKRKKEYICLFVFFLSPRVNLRFTVYRVNVRNNNQRTTNRYLNLKISCFVRHRNRKTYAFFTPSTKSKIQPSISMRNTDLYHAPRSPGAL